MNNAKETRSVNQEKTLQPKSSSSSETVFENAKRIARITSQTFGRNCEVAVHDFKDLEHSLIHIEGSVTKRNIGAPITDLVVKAWRTEGDSVQDIASYRTQTSDGRILKSSTTFLRDSTGKVIGALCTNFDITDFFNATSLMQDMISVHADNNISTETFAKSAMETREALIEQAAKSIGKTPTTMNKAQKIQCIAFLEQNGGFLIKGMVDYVAECMGISKFTVYSYLKKVRSNSQ